MTKHVLVGVTLALVLSVVSRGRALAQGSCSDLTRDGIADTSTTMSNEEVAASYRRWFCDKQFSSSSEAENYSLNAMLPFEGVPVQLGFDASRDEWSTWRAEVCSDEQRSLWSKTSFVQLLRTQNVELAKVVSDCITKSGDGLLVWVQRTSEAKFRVIAQYKSSLTNPPSVRLSLTVDDDATCKGNLTKRFVGPNRDAWLCARKTDRTGNYVSREAIQMTISSQDISPIWGNDLVVPAVYVPDERVVPPLWPIYVTAAMIAKCDTRGEGGGKAPPSGCAGIKPVNLRGVEIDKGIVYTQPYAVSGGHSEAVIRIPPGNPRQFKFTVGDPYMGGDCRNDPNKKGMLMYVYVDGDKKWEASLDIHGGQDIFSGNVPLLSGAKEVRLVGDTGDGPYDCDDAVWGNLHFDQ